jgi:hypothetical protein
MQNKTGYNKPGFPSNNIKPHLGELILKKYGDRITEGHFDLEKFEQLDQLRKPVLSFIFWGNKKKILEVNDFLGQFPYSYIIRTKKGFDIWNLPKNGVRNAYVYISRFPKLINFIMNNERNIPSDLWGLLYGYILAEIHQFTYDWESWAKKMNLKL